MIYLDSAATSLLKPPSVARATAMAVRTMASPGRGGHSAAMRAADTVFACREAAAELFHVPEPERVVFTMNATHALNIAIHSLVSPGDPVVISGYEHQLRHAPAPCAGRAGARGGKSALRPRGSGQRLPARAAGCEGGRVHDGVECVRLSAAGAGDCGTLRRRGRPTDRGCLAGGRLCGV